MWYIEHVLLEHISIITNTLILEINKTLHEILNT